MEVTCLQKVNFIYLFINLFVCCEFLTLHIAPIQTYSILLVCSAFNTSCKNVIMVGFYVKMINGFLICFTNNNVKSVPCICIQPPLL